MVNGSALFFEMKKKEGENSKCGSFSSKESIFILFFILNSDWKLSCCISKMLGLRR